METYPSLRNRTQAAGFTLLEVLFSILILVVGLVAMASLVAQTVTGTERSRDMGLASTLASEKLEDLNRWPTVDPNVAAGGSLGADTTVGTIDYFDDVVFASTSGQVSETVSTKVGGTITYTTTSHTAGGIVTTTSSTTAPSTTGQTAFHRRWIIESDPVVNSITLTGTRRVTVLVTLSNSVVKPAVNFQMSLVRP